MMLHNPLATVAQLAAIADEDDSDVLSGSRASLRFRTVRAMQVAGILLHLGQEIIAKSIITFDRYWLCAAPLICQQGLVDAAAAALFLTTKLSAQPQSPRSILNALTCIRAHEFSVASALPAPTLNERQFVLTEGEYLDRMHYMLQTEVLILRASGFQTSIALPHCLALNYIRTLDGHISPLIHQLASETIAHLNTALLSPQLLYLTNQPNALAAAAVYLGAREVGVKLPELPWWEVFDVDREQLGFLVVAMLSMDAFAESIQKSSSSKRPLPW